MSHSRGGGSGLGSCEEWRRRGIGRGYGPKRRGIEPWPLL